jgi:DnaJ-class molecular chaperone
MNADLNTRTVIKVFCPLCEGAGWVDTYTKRARVCRLCEGIGWLSEEERAS